MAVENLFDLRAVAVGNVGKQDALMRSQPEAGPHLATDFANRPLQLDLFIVEQPAVFHIQTIEPVIVPLLVPT